MSNNKLFFRSVGIVATFSETNEDVSRHALLRSIYKTDTVSAEVRGRVPRFSRPKPGFCSAHSAWSQHLLCTCADGGGAHLGAHCCGGPNERLGRPCRAHGHCAGCQALVQLCKGRRGGSQLGRGQPVEDRLPPRLFQHMQSQLGSLCRRSSSRSRLCARRWRTSNSGFLGPRDVHWLALR